MTMFETSCLVVYNYHSPPQLIQKFHKYGCPAPSQVYTKPGVVSPTVYCHPVDSRTLN